MKTIRLLYPDHVSGGLDTYYFGANLLQYIIPENPDQPLVKVDIKEPDYDTQYTKLKEILGSIGEKVWIAKTFSRV